MSRQNGGSRPDVAFPALPAGTLVDHFVVVRPLGRGGMGEVYLARDMRLGRLVALKMVLPEKLDDRRAMDRLVSEAQLTARFSHQHIVAIHSVGPYRGGVYLALEYLEGQSLASRLAERRPAPKEAMRMGLAMARALAEAHRNGVLHRDLKPSNVVLPRDGRLRVLDFGVATSSFGGRVEAHGTPRPVGTPRYIAPEQWRGLPCTEATDVWSLGVVLYEMLAGAHPYRGMDRRQVELAVASTQPAPLLEPQDGVPEELATLVGRCLSKEPSGRPSAEEVALQIEGLLAGPRRSMLTSPFRGLLPFSERHADLFFGRRLEVETFLERMRADPVLAVVGPSGAGKTSFVQAGVIPRLRDQGSLLVLRLRPGDRPLERLARTVLAARERPSSALTDGGDDWQSPRASAGEQHSTTPESTKDATVREVPLGNEPTSAGELRCEPTDLDGPAPPAPRPPAVQPERETTETLRRRLLDRPGALAIELTRLADSEQANVLLFVDQLEELYTLSDDVAARRAFVAALAGAADDPLGPVRVILAVRDDFLGRVAETPEARRALGHVSVLGAPGPGALREAVLEPVARMGYDFEDPEVPAEMVAAVEGEAASLPLLQFACSRLWEERDRERKLLTRASYESMGGVEGAIARHADQSFAALRPDLLDAARRILLRLVTAERTRRVVPRPRLLDGLPEEAGAVLGMLVSSRAVSIRKADGDAEAELELIHESLITKWQRLGRWLDESHEDRVFLSEIGQAAELWDRRGRRDDEVWQGPALDQALARAARCADRPDLVDNFLEAGRSRRTRQARRRRAAATAGFLAIALVALVLGLLAAEAQRQRRAVEAQNAETERQRRAVEVQHAVAQREAARGVLERGDLLEARGRLRRALELRDSSAARALWLPLDRHAQVWRRVLPDRAVYEAAFSPDGRRIALASSDGIVRLLDVETSEAELLRGHRGQIYTVAFSPDGARLVTGTMDGEVGIWSLETRSVVLTKGHGGAVSSVRFHPDGAVFASAGVDETVRVWDAATGTEVRALPVGRRACSVVFAPDGALLLAGDEAGAIRIFRLPGFSEVEALHTEGPVWELELDRDGEILVARSNRSVTLFRTRDWTELEGPPRGEGTLFGSALSPDGGLVAVGGAKRVNLWDVEARAWRPATEGLVGEELCLRFGPRDDFLVAAGRGDVALFRVASFREERLPQAHTRPVWGLAFSPDGRTLASGSMDGSIRIWDVATGTLRRRPLVEGDETVSSLEYGPDGTLLASASLDGTARLWDAASGTVRALLRGHSDFVGGIAFHPGGSVVATASQDRTVRVWDVESGAALRVLEQDARMESIDYSGDGRLLAAGGSDGVIRIWETRSYRLVTELTGHEGLVWGLHFSTDGRRLASGGFDGTARLWDVGTGEGRVVHSLDGRVYSVQLSPEGTRLGVPASDGTVRVLDLAHGEQPLLLSHPDEANAARFSPDGTLVATASDDGVVRLWSASTGSPVWRAPVLLSEPAELLTHEGWVRLREGGGEERLGEWRRALEGSTRTAEEHRPARLLCSATHEDGLELWDTGADELLRRVPLPGIEAVVALPWGCAALAGGRVHLVGRTGEPHEVSADATAIGADGELVLAARGREVVAFGGDGRQVERHDADSAATAVARLDAGITAGYRDGTVELVSGPEGRGAWLDDLPAAAVTALAAGPAGTVIAGFADGRLGIWSLEDGSRLLELRLHGPVAHLLIEDETLYAASGLGDHVSVSLEVLYWSYCELLREVWRTVPVLWEQGRFARTPPPEGHRCRE